MKTHLRDSVWKISIALEPKYLTAFSFPSYLSSMRKTYIEVSGWKITITLDANGILEIAIEPP